MRVLSICMAVIILFIAVSASAEEMNGFRGFTWGDSLDKMRESDPKLVEGHMGTMPGVKAFKRNEEDLNYGGIKVEGITYVFYKDILSSVSIDFRGYDNYERLLAYCKKQFGQSTGSAVVRLEQYTSFDTPSTGVMLLYQLSLQTSNNGRLYLYSKELLK
jgi:hypothetical protein